ncbi:site-specific integrase, partial [Dyella sp.]|uniref:tyrosine-type recombinase/integrase n=1 Tax=Dyella sp. TaxID=1869338 RepID=UPI002FD96160
MPRIRITDEYALVKRTGSDKWYLEWRSNGEKQRRSTGTSDIGEARVKARDIILSEATIKNVAPEEITIAIVLDRYMRKRGEALASKDPAKRANALWKEYFGNDAVVSDLTLSKQEDFLSWLVLGKALSEQTARRYVAHGKAALNRAWKNQEITKVPFIELPPIGDPYPHISQLQQMATFLNAIPETSSHIWLYCIIRLCTDCRGDAARDLTPQQVDFQAKLIQLNPPGRKQTKKYRPVVPLIPTLEVVLKAENPTGTYVHWRGKQVKSVKTSWRKLRNAAGLPGWFAPKVIRHTVATEMRRRGVPSWEVSGQIGHKRAGTSEIYAKFDPDYLGKAATALETMMQELAALVPKLAGVIPGSVRKKPDFQVLTQHLENTGLEDGGRYKDRTCDPFHVKE